VSGTGTVPELDLGGGFPVKSQRELIDQHLRTREGAEGERSDSSVGGAIIGGAGGGGGGFVGEHNDLEGRDEPDCHPADAITNTPAGKVAATEVQAAINELDTEKLARDGTQAMTGALDMGTHKISAVVDPALDQDAATKKYVDNLPGSITDLCWWRTSGGYYSMPATIGAPSAMPLMQDPDILFAHPFLSPKQLTYDRIGIYVQVPVALSNARLGIYEDNGSLYPGSISSFSRTASTGS